MAEINAAASGTRPGVRRVKKLSTRVDLTPMVDLGFLLITFFVFTTTMSEPKGLTLINPKDSNDSLPISRSTALTIFPLSNGKVFFYHGELKDAVKINAYGITTYHVATGIGQVIRDKQAAMERQEAGFSKRLFVVIKPTDEANYQQVTDMLDEMLINQVKSYALSDVAEQEKELILQLNGSL